jgi:hypothetical protein
MKRRWQNRGSFLEVSSCGCPDGTVPLDTGFFAERVPPSLYWSSAWPWFKALHDSSGVYRYRWFLSLL